MSDPLRNLRALRHKLAHHAARLEQMHAPHLACRVGCDGCCQSEPTLTPVEFRALREAASRLPESTRTRLAAQVDAEHCTLLLDGACAMYDDRPLICRSQGLPMAMEGHREVCPLNFTDGDIHTLADDEVLSVDALTAILIAVSQLYAQEEGEDAGTRRAVGELFS